MGTVAGGETVVGGTDVFVAPGPACTVVGDPAGCVVVGLGTVVSGDGATVVPGSHLPEGQGTVVVVGGVVVVVTCGGVDVGVGRGTVVVLTGGIQGGTPNSTGRRSPMLIPMTLMGTHAPFSVTVNISDGSDSWLGLSPTSGSPLATARPPATRW